MEKQSTENHRHDHQHSGHEHHGLVDELVCHFPYAIFAVALSLICLALLGYDHVDHHKAHQLHGLFHTLHFLHILFASTGTVMVYRRYQKSIAGSLLVGSIVPAIFCTLSDAIIPYLGGRLFGVHMHFHWCFVDHISTIIPFLLVGIINGIVMSYHNENSQDFYAGGSHFAHIFISAFASTVYLVSHGFYHWSSHMGFVFLYLIIAVLLPCTLADIVVPTWFGKIGNKN